MRFLLALLRRWKLRRELYDDQPDRHPALARISRGELLPFKGTNWRIADIREQPIPAIVLVPVGETRASKLGRLKELRREDRILEKVESRMPAAVRKHAEQGAR